MHAVGIRRHDVVVVTFEFTRLGREHCAKFGQRIDLTGLQCREPRVLVRVDANLDSGQGRLLAPVVLVALEGGELIALPVDQHEWSAANRQPGEVVVLVELAFPPLHAVVVRNRVRQERPRLGIGELHGVVVDSGDGRIAVDLFEEDAAKELRRLPALGLRPFNVEQHRGRGERLAVREHHVVAEFEFPCETVRTEGPLGRQARQEVEVVVVLDQRLIDLKAGMHVPVVLLATDQVAVDPNPQRLVFTQSLAVFQHDSRWRRVLGKSGHWPGQEQSENEEEDGEGASQGRDRQLPCGATGQMIHGLTPGKDPGSSQTSAQPQQQLQSVTDHSFLAACG